jgi:C4-dicarboxylate-specific signal transduction histidine kinase
MATQIAHEVNQPITALVTYCAAAQRHIQAELPENARLAGLISAISEEAQRVSQIIRRLRDFARRGEISFVAADVNEIVRDCLRLVAAETAAQHVQVVEELAPGPLQVMADPLLVSQATQNLLRNAIEAVATVPEDRRLIRVATQRKGRAVEVRITDSGPGLAPAVSERLFEAFITTKPSGLGMGLSIARTIIEAHGGQIHHSAAPGGGCIFTFILPGVDA